MEISFRRTEPIPIEKLAPFGIWIPTSRYNSTVDAPIGSKYDWDGDCFYILVLDKSRFKIVVEFATDIIHIKENRDETID